VYFISTEYHEIARVITVFVEEDASLSGRNKGNEHDSEKFNNRGHCNMRFELLSLGGVSRSRTLLL